VHGNQIKSIPDAYTRYLANVFRKTFDLFANPVVIDYRTDENPYTRRLRPSTRPTRRPPSRRQKREAKQKGR